MACSRGMARRCASHGRTRWKTSKPEATMLIQTPNGNWLDPKTITAIRALEPIDDLDSPCPWRVCINHSRDNVDMKLCRDEEDAIATRDNFAAILNEALNPAPSTGGDEDVETA